MIQASEETTYPDQVVPIHVGFHNHDGTRQWAFGMVKNAGWFHFWQNPRQSSFKDLNQEG